MYVDMELEQEKIRYEYALRRMEELLPLVSEDMPMNNPLAVELAIVSDIVIDYEKKYYLISRVGVCP
jgi:HTH-type transcriptional regulator/antitoxin HigA